MRPKHLYRSATVLLIIFAALHTFGFSQVDPKWGIDALIQQMKAGMFDIQGQQRTYWDFFYGFGLTVTAFQIFTGLVAWELGGLPPESLAAMPVIRWSLVAVMGVMAWLNWKYFFPAPLLFSVVITVCLAAAAWMARRTT
jgi:hypothetical protein